jgi:ABC-type transport system involved in cytochrome bd biosynthesis fused ATPase/permease subunit
MAKVALARAYKRCASFNFDEPTAALDAREQKFSNVLQNLLKENLQF